MLRRIAIVFIVSLVLGSCSREVTPEPFVPDRTRWVASGISNYEFSVMHFNAWDAPPPIHIVVRNERVYTVSIVCPPRIEGYSCDNFLQVRNEQYSPDQLIDEAMTVPELFDFAEAQSKIDPRAQVKLVLDPIYGYPARFSFDRLESFDEERAFWVYDFAVTK